MADTSKPRKRRERPQTPGAERPPNRDHPVEKEPAVEWGERIDTGKTIARGGKEAGHVPGATARPAGPRE
jgi:hypothetical protein